MRQIGLCKLTEKQRQLFQKARLRLPTGYHYRLQHGHKHPHVWGVCLYWCNDRLGYVSCRAQYYHTDCQGRPERELIRTLLNNASNSLWHKKPDWERENEALASLAEAKDANVCRPKVVKHKKKKVHSGAEILKLLAKLPPEVVQKAFEDVQKRHEAEVAAEAAAVAATSESLAAIY